MARTLVLNGLMQSDLDADGHRINNLDTSNLRSLGIPPSVVAPLHNFLTGWDAPSKVWSFARPGFTDLSGFLSDAQMGAISKVGTIFSGTWKGTPLLNDRVPSLDGIRAPINNVGMAGKRLTGLANPVDPQDAVTKAFMDLLL